MTASKINPALLRQNRGWHELRPLKVERRISRHAEGSALIQLGHTQVMVTATLEEKSPPHLIKKASSGKRLPAPGWLNAEYSLLPRATAERTQRERLYAGGRTVEIQRLLGRSLRMCVNLELFPNQTITIDADVLQADGGTRVASIIGGFVALHDLADRLTRSGRLDEWPLQHEIAAVSVGMVGGRPCLDLDYSEDAVATADLNVVATSNGELIEIQGGAEGAVIRQDMFMELVALGLDGVKDIIAKVKAQI
jgi:ribonuclease PH